MQKNSEYRRKNLLYSAFLLMAFLGIWLYREFTGDSDPGPEGQKIELLGTTMGTTYAVKYLDPQARNLQPQIDSVLQAFNMSLSTYIPESEISRFNRQGQIRWDSPFFYPVLVRSKEIYKITGGAFDPTVGPLVNAWGFGPEARQSPTKERVDSLRQLVSYDSIVFDTASVQKKMADMQLDFSAIAKGYGVDVVSRYLMGNGIENLFVEIGGEIYAHGLSDRGSPWMVGVNYPSEDIEEQQQAQAIVGLENRAIATSGNYRNFYEVEGVKYSHTIDPESGYPVAHSLLSASVFAPDCMTADAYATAFMVLGWEKAAEIDKQEEEIEVYLIYSDEEGKLHTYASAGIEDKIKVIRQ